MQKLLKPVFVAAFAALTLATSLLEPQSSAQTVSRHQKSGHQGALADPLLTGSDGSQTGIAKFQGNLTAITAPSGQALVLPREPDCSLSLFTGTISLSPHFTYNSTGFFADYERTLHTNAGLTSTPDTSASCSSPATGFGTRRGVFVGQTTTGLLVFADVYYNPVLGTNALLVSSGITSFAWTAFSFSAAGAITTADLNGDGNGDLVVVNADSGATPSSQVFVLLGNPDGTFQTAVPYTVPGNASISAVIDDVNGDGKLDIVVSSDNGQISIFTGKGDGSFNSAQSFAAPTPVYPGSTATPSSALTNLITANLRGGGKKDIIASNGLVLLNDGSGNFTAASSAAFPPITSNSEYGPNLATGDINKDGKLDLVVSTGGTVLIYLGKGDGTFSPGARYTTVNTDGFVNVSDLDGDGNLDIYIGEANGGYYFGDDLNLSYALMGNGDGTFQGAPAIPGAYTGTNLGDVNGDGIPDLITNATGQSSQTLPTFTVQLGNGKGTFTPGGTIIAPASFIGTTSGLTSSVTITNANTVGATSYAVADVNGDGKADLVFVDNGLTAINPSNNQPITYPAPIYFVALSNGDGTFATPVPYNFPQIAPSGDFDNSVTATTVQIGDFNHDGHNDLVFTFNEFAGGSPAPAFPYSSGFVVLLGNGDGTFGAPVITTTASSGSPIFAPSSVIFSAVDVNKDGNSDLLAITKGGTPTSGFANQLQIYLSKGDGTFQPPITPSTAANPGLINTGAPCILADLNKDSKLDLICLGETNASQGQLAISLGNGDGTFATATIFNVAGGDAVRSSGIAAADFDGDGNVDLAYLNTNSFSGILYGKGDGTFTSVPLNGSTVPKDLLNLFAGGTSIAVDLNKDNKPDILAGNTILLNTYATAPPIVTQSSTTTSIAASATSIARGASVTFTATVTGATPTGQVIFGDGDLQIGSATVDATGKATFTTSALASGSHSITAAYGGSATLLGSLSSTITVTVAATAATTTTTTLAASASSITAGSSITFTATVAPTTGSGTPTGTVTFFDGTNVLGTGTIASGKATYTTSSLAVGTHSITAVYGGDTSFSGSTSSAASISVTVTPTTTALAASATTAVSGTSLTFTATVTPASGTTSPAGTVTFSDGTTTLGTGTLASGTATYTTSTLAVGTHSITAAYGGSAAFSASTSSPALAVTITAASQDFTLSLANASSTVQRGSTVGSNLTITGGANQSFTLSCTGAPANSNCSVGTTLTLANGNTSAIVAVIFNAFLATSGSLRPVSNIQVAGILPFGLIGCVAIFALGTRRRRNLPLPLIAIVFAALLAASGCGHKSTNINGPTPGVYPLTITVTSGTIAHSATYTVTVQ
jgi:hypothetical protein